MSVLDELDELDLDELDDFLVLADDARTAFLTELGEASPDYHQAKDSLREHPDVEAIVSASRVGIIGDDAALDELRSLVTGWAVPVPSGNLQALQGSQDQPGEAFRPCQWKGEDDSRCALPARPRKGPRGPLSRWCDEHTKERKRLQDGGNSKPREPYRECCEQWQADGNAGLCQQHRDHRDESREWDQAHSVSQREISWLLEQLGAAEGGEMPKGWHIYEPQPKGWKSARGPWEGRTRPEVFHGDPYQDGEGKQWLDANDGWRKPAE